MTAGTGVDGPGPLTDVGLPPSSQLVPPQALGGPSVRPVPRGRRSAGRGLLSAVGVIGLSLGAAHLSGQAELSSRPVAVQDRPTPGLEASDTPLGTPLPAPPGGGTHEFVAVQADGATPVSYDPCRPVHYVVRPDHAPPGGEQLLHEAVARVSAVTGLRFVHDGPTDERSGATRQLFQLDRYGDRWAPVLISWQTEAENPGFGTDIAGEAGSVPVSVDGGPMTYVSGVVDLDAAAFAQLLADPDGVPVARAVVLHELGHLVGLGHVSDAAQLMYPETSGVLDFAAGDLTGLARLGSGPCVPEL